MVHATSDELRRLRRAEILLDVYQRTAGLESLDEVLLTLVNIVSTQLGAERGTLFLYDAATGELYSRVAQGNLNRELRVQSSKGVAGHVFTTGHGAIVADAYADPHFDPVFDQRTGFVTRSILCAPIRTVKNEIIGVIQILNKREGHFDADELSLLEAMCTQASMTLMGAQVIERMNKTRAQELRFLEVVTEVTSEIEINVLLKKVMDEATKMLNAERSTLFLNDERTNELWSLVGAVDVRGGIRLPNHLGIAGAVFTSGKSVEIPHAYADLRFNPAFDKKTGFFTRSILCVPVVNKKGKTIGVTQVLNKRGGPFTAEDESRLRAFTAQVSIALENAKLFNDVQNIKNYNESMLESMSNGVITLDEDRKIITCNAAGQRILRMPGSAIINQKAKDFFAEPNAFVLALIQKVEDSKEPDTVTDADLQYGDKKISVNLTVAPLKSGEKRTLGTMLMIEDISSEKRMKSTMSRYIDPSIADKLLGDGGDILGGKAGMATVLFSDIRSFTTISEELGAQGTVNLLNDYFTIMMESIQRESGLLDKFIGDAIMAAFGMPIAHDDDEDRGVRAAISMMTDLANWNRERVERGLRTLDIGIGLNTDMVLAGNIGSPKRMGYTLIGDGVNLAARLESACKQYAAHILISENTQRRLKATYRIREIDRVVVKGKTKPVAIFEVMDYYNEETFPNLSEVCHHFKGGLGHYRDGQWNRAINSFKEALALNPGDKLSGIYVDRCEHMKANPPAGEWDGVYVMLEK
ncbi:MAG: GAF domain-containing protein [Deltaproteobacteria bacterium]|nr:GAF domain-containing protein [Deltaproteobacteria bacterium]